MKVSTVFCRILGFILLILSPIVMQAQITKEDYIRAEQFLSWNANKLVFNTEVMPNWIEKSGKFWYRKDTRSGKMFILVDANRNTSQPAFNHVKLAAALSRATDTSYEPHKLPFSRFQFIQREGAIQFELEKTSWTCDLTTYKCTKTKIAKESFEVELRSPDNRWAAFLRNYNLYVRSVKTGKEVKLTSDGELYYDYASRPDSRTTAVRDRINKRKMLPAAIWSPDSKKLVTYRLDQREVGELHLIRSVLPKEEGARPELYSYRYPLPGDRNVAKAELIIFDVEKKKKVEVNSDPLNVLLLSPITAQLVWWSENNERIYFLRKERGFKALKLHMADAHTGTTRTIIEERGSTYVELNLTFWLRPNVRVLSGSSEIIWFSERDGWAHLYLYDEKTGIIKNQITSGTWVVRDIVHVDEKNRWIYFTAGGRETNRDPYFRHLYRVKLDGSNMQLLTPEDAEHRIMFSPNGNYFVDTYSRVNAAPVSVLRASDGRLIRELERADIALLLAKGWKFPEPFSAKARDGTTDIYGVIYRPSNFDPKKKYPVLDSVYPGPQTIRSPKSFTINTPDEAQSLAELGFIVVNIDGRGTPYRSKAFHNISYRNLQAAGGLKDHISALRQLTGRYPYIDLDRVGIYGHSGGGYASTRAILTYPDFYKVAVSSAGNYDQRGNIAFWGEKYQGLPEGDNYQEQANASLAQNLKGKLFMVYGDMDDNVHYSLTIQLVDALIKSNKDFDLLVLPNRYHGFAKDPYFIRKRWDYFVKHLLGQEPPAEYKIRGSR